MKNIFTPKLHPKVRLNDILIKHHKTITYGTKSLKTLSPKIWNQLPEDIKSETSYTNCKEYVETWFGPLKIFETLSVKMCANHLPEGCHVFYYFY